MSEGSRRLRVLFVCTHNSARSQMGEGFLRAVAGERFEVESAGTERTAVHPLTFRRVRDQIASQLAHWLRTEQSSAVSDLSAPLQARP